ncbi:MAG: ribosome maturation factor RimM [Bacteroidia bacterium]
MLKAPAGSPTWVGFIQKPHGLNGRLLVHLDTAVSKSQWPPRFEHVWLETRGQKVPYRCLESQFKVPGGLILHLEGLNSPQDVQPLVKSRVGIEGVRLTPIVSSGSAWGFEEEDLPGAFLIDPQIGLRAPLVRLHRRPPQDFLEFTVNEQAVYLPLVPDFVRQWNPTNRELEVSLPDGLLDLYLAADSDEKHHPDAD